MLEAASLKSNQRSPSCNVLTVADVPSWNISDVVPSGASSSAYVIACPTKEPLAVVYKLGASFNPPFAVVLIQTSPLVGELGAE